MKAAPKTFDWVSVLREVARDVALGDRVTVVGLVRYVGYSPSSAWNVLAWLREAARSIGAQLVVGGEDIEEEGLVRVEGLDARAIGLEQPEQAISERSRRRARIRELGLCVDCKAPAEARGLCPKHLEMSRARERKRRARLAEAGLCRDCMAPSPDFRLCEGCRDRLKPGHRSLYLAKRRAGLCICRAPARPGKATCQRCFERQTAAEKSRSDDRRARGRCTACGKRPNDGETQRCKRCREKHRIASLKSQRKKNPPKRMRKSA